MQESNKRAKLLDFEIEFYEKLVEKYPDFVDVLIPLAEAYTRKGLNTKGLLVDEKLVQLKKDDPFVWYNLSCSYSILNRIDEAFTAMRRAIDCGYDDLKHLQRDADLHNLRNSSLYADLVESIERLKQSAAN